MQALELYKILFQPEDVPCILLFATDVKETAIPTASFVGLVTNFNLFTTSSLIYESVLPLSIKALPS